jgi:hypothetical protein
VRQILATPADNRQNEAHYRARLQQMLEFLQMVTGWYSHIRALPVAAVRQLLTSSGAPPSPPAGAQAARKR